MGDRSSIEWTDATWNPIVGCTRCSPGCDHCYAIGVVHRGMSPQHRGLTVVTDDGVDWNGQINVVEHLLEQPLRWRKPRRIFVNSLSDLFHPAVDDDTILRIFTTMARAGQHTFQVLTKRPQRMAWFCRRLSWDDVGPAGELDQATAYLSGPPSEEPLPNVWLGVSIESNRYAWRADHLRATPAAVRWISAEPLLGPLDQVELTGIDWVVAGGESGPGARPMHPEWVRDLLGRCCMTCVECGDEIGHGADETVHVHTRAPHQDHEPRRPAFLFKQWGSWVSQSSPAVTEEMIRDAQRRPDQSFSIDRDGTIENPAVLGHHAIYRMPKAAAGRVLDGRTWDEFPEVAGV